jgi:hypothetical protein
MKSECDIEGGIAVGTGVSIGFDLPRGPGAGPKSKRRLDDRAEDTEGDDSRSPDIPLMFGVPEDEPAGSRE